MAIPTPGSLAAVMDGLVALEETVHDDLRVYRWRPPGVPELPALYNWVRDSPAKLLDTAHIRDTVNLIARVGVEHSDVDEETAKVEVYADAFRDVVDAALNERLSNTVLGGAATWATRTGFQTVLDSFNTIEVLCVEFRLELRLDRPFNP